VKYNTTLGLNTFLNYDPCKVRRAEYGWNPRCTQDTEIFHRREKIQGLMSAFPRGGCRKTGAGGWSQNQ
jgi:hypothetical protein